MTNPGLMQSSRAASTAKAALESCKQCKEVAFHSCNSNVTNLHQCSPPEELVLPKQFPRVRTPFIAALLSPLAWQVGRPDLFDSYSAGVLLLQMAGALLHHKYKQMKR